MGKYSFSDIVIASSLLKLYKSLYYPVIFVVLTPILTSYHHPQRKNREVKQETDIR